MPYREPAPPSGKRRVVEHGPFRLAWVRLALFAILAIAIVGSLRVMLARAIVSCEGGECELRVTGLGTTTQRFAASQLRGAEVWYSELTGTYVGGHGGSYSSMKAFTPRLVLEDGELVLFETEEQEGSRFCNSVAAFVAGESATLHAEIAPTHASSILQLIVFCPFALIFLVSGLRSSGGTVRLSVEGNLLAVQRRWRFFGGRIQRFAVDEIRGVEVDRSGRKARLTLLMQTGREIDLSDRRFLSRRAGAHEQAAQELRIALACVAMPEEAPAPSGSVPLGALVGGMIGFVFGLALFGACDLLLNFAAASVEPDRTLLIVCLSFGALAGAIGGALRAR